MSEAHLNHEKAIDWSWAGRPMSGQTVSGDVFVVQPFDHSVLLGVIDGVGHGNEAHAVAQTAAEVLRANASESVITLIRLCHEALARTRGAVMTLATLNVREKTVTWLGVGNVEARLFRADANISPSRESILLRNGLVGLQLPALQASVMPLSPGDLLIFATDGLHAGFDQRLDLTETPREIAERILSQHFKGMDDALALVIRRLGPS